MALTKKQKKSKRIREMDSPFAGLLGEELVANGTFATDPAVEWTVGSGWSWNEAKDTIDTDGTIGAISQTVVITEGSSYLLSFDVIGVNDGSKNFIVVLGGIEYTIGPKNGLHSSAIKAGATTLFEISVDGTDAYIGSLDNVSLKKIG
ncbi:MAG: hypothetical protein DRQ78_04700 [Epsilonproteobacteria bacterium]|nr:MAG: hypothetical protein DRQ78_04700 [Campylobacterota bacterium]